MTVLLDNDASVFECIVRVKRVWSLTGGAVSVAVLLRADVGPVVVGLMQIIVFLLEELKQRLRLLSPRVACDHGKPRCMMSVNS